MMTDVIEIIDAGAVDHYQPGDEWVRALSDYLQGVEGRSGSKGSHMVYQGILTRFFQGIDVAPGNVRTSHVEAFMRSDTDRGAKPAPSTQGVRRAAIRGFYELARKRGLVERNPADDANRPGTPDPMPKGLDAIQVRKLLASIPDTARGLEDRAIIVTLVLTGLRRTELLALTRGNLFADGDRVLYETRVKGGHTRKRELPPPALASITAALEARGLQLEAMDDDAPLFVSSVQMFYRALKRYGNESGLGNVTPHVLRHTAAKLRRDDGATIEEVGAFLGHRNIATTARYLARLEGESDTRWQGAAAAIGVTA